MRDEDDTIPTVETYRGVGIHDQQTATRIAEVVKPAIDDVFLMTDPRALLDYAGDVSRPPEARLLAAARCEAAWDIATESRIPRPNVNMELVRASVAGLRSVKWRHPSTYSSLLDVPSRPGATRRPDRRERALGRS